MRNEINALRALATVAMRVVSQYDAKNPQWPGTGRWKSLPCRSCGASCDPTRRWCKVCSGVLP